jgi:anti-sigma-K factor RskA
MSSTFNHDEIELLLGAYAVDAVSDDERTAIENHLESCDECRREADELRSSAALLGAATPVDEPKVWARIRSEISPAVTPPPLRMQSAEMSKSDRLMRNIFAAAAALIILAGVFGAGMMFGGSGSNSDNTLALAESAAQSTNARVISLSSPTDRALKAMIVITPDGHGYVYDSSLPALPKDRTYQLWAVVNNTAISAAVFTNNATPFAANGPITAFAITEETTGGVVHSANNPVISGNVTA